MLQTVEENLIINTTSTTQNKEKVAASSEVKAIETNQAIEEPATATPSDTSESKGPLEEAADDFDDLFSLVAIDRKPPAQPATPKAANTEEEDTQSTPIAVIEDVKNDL